MKHLREEDLIRLIVSEGFSLIVVGWYDEAPHFMVVGDCGGSCSPMEDQEPEIMVEIKDPTSQDLSLVASFLHISFTS